MTAPATTPGACATALIAEDEPLLAQALHAELNRLWPTLAVLETVGDGLSAVARSLALQPQVLFLDIRMPGQGGLEAAQQLADEWPEGRPFPLLVFVTAFDQYAVEAFEAQAIDYVLKPVNPRRLARTVERLQQELGRRTSPDAALEAAVSQLRHLLAPAAPASRPRLEFIQAGVGTGIRMVPLDEVLVFEAADKYVRVLTAGPEYLIRTPLKDLLPQLDPQQFWQVHRGTVVRAAAIDTVTREENGKLHLTVRGRTGRVPVSRVWAHLFKAM